MNHPLLSIILASLTAIMLVLLFLAILLGLILGWTTYFFIIRK